MDLHDLALALSYQQLLFNEYKNEGGTDMKPRSFTSSTSFTSTVIVATGANNQTSLMDLHLRKRSPGVSQPLWGAARVVTARNDAQPRSSPMRSGA